MNLSNQLTKNIRHTEVKYFNDLQNNVNVDRKVSVIDRLVDFYLGSFSELEVKPYSLSIIESKFIFILKIETPSEVIVINTLKLDNSKSETSILISNISTGQTNYLYINSGEYGSSTNIVDENVKESTIAIHISMSLINFLKGSFRYLSIIKESN